MSSFILERLPASSALLVRPKSLWLLNLDGRIVEEKIIGILQRQILFQEKTFQDAKSGSLFIALLESTKKVGELKIVTLENSLGFIASASPSGLKAAEFEETLRA